MNDFKYFWLFLFFFPLCKAADDCSVPPTAGDITRLRKTLLCNYDRYNIPSTNLSGGAAQVTVVLGINSLSMEEHRENMNLNGLIQFHWFDERLHWKKADYGGLKFLKFDGSEIWVPDITLNLLMQNGVRELQTGNCAAEDSGLVLCMSNVNLQVPCTQDMRHFPFDEHNCTFSLSSLMHFEHQINITIWPDFRQLKRHNGFEIVDSTTKLHKVNMSAFFGGETYYPIQVISISVKRHAGAVAASVILPAFGLMVLMLTTFWMSSQLTIRVMVCGFVSLGFITYLTMVNFALPSNGDSVPVLVTILRDGYLLTVFAAVVAVTVGNMAASNAPPPRWLTRITDWVELGFLRRLLLPSSSAPPFAGDEDATILDGASKVHPWTTATQILDRLAFFVTIVVIGVLFAGYIP